MTEPEIYTGDDPYWRGRALDAEDRVRELERLLESLWIALADGDEETGELCDRYGKRIRAALAKPKETRR